MISKYFLKKTSFFFISNDVSKTHRFYEFILVDTESVQISHIRNSEATDIAYSKCNILKIISKNDWEQNPFTHKLFSQIKPLIILITKMHGLTHFLPNLLPIHGFLIREKNLKHFFQTGSKNGSFSLKLFQIFFVPTYEKPLIISKPIVKFFSLMETYIQYYFVLSLGSLGFSIETLPLIICSHLFFPNIWPENLKSNGGLPSKFLKLKPLNQSKIGLILKNPNLKNLQKKTYVWSSSLLEPLSWPQTPSKTFFLSNSAYKAYLKKVQEQDAETLSLLSDSDDDDDEDIASSSAFQQNEDMCYAPIHSP